MGSKRLVRVCVCVSTSSNIHFASSNAQENCMFHKEETLHRTARQPTQAPLSFHTRRSDLRQERTAGLVCHRFDSLPRRHVRLEAWRACAACASRHCLGATGTRLEHSVPRCQISKRVAVGVERLVDQHQPVLLLLDALRNHRSFNSLQRLQLMRADGGVLIAACKLVLAN